MDDLKQIERSALQRAKSAKSLQELNAVRSEVLGKKGSLGGLLRSLGELPAAERPEAGKKINAVKENVEAALSDASERLEAAARDSTLAANAVDVTLPGRRVARGAEHPLRIIEREAIRALAGLGFTVAEGPIVEHDWYNFEALNFPPEHPTRDAQDTFFVTKRVLLRTHTSNVQTRTMVARKPPVRILAPGMVCRRDEVDPTHSPVFHQIEGLWIDDRTSFADLKGVLHTFAAHMFGPATRVRFRPSFFPFTEPSAEMDVSCVACGGKGEGCRLCKSTGWLEILGAGMVDPAVLAAVGYDPQTVQGFAFGAGIERMAILRFGIDDIRHFFENDLRFLEQFSGYETR